MKVINLTPDSFWEPSRCSASDFPSRLEACSDADIIDIGAVSSRPGFTAVSEEEEWLRLQPALEYLAGHSHPRISIDTSRSSIVRRAYDLIGDFLVNDISAGEDDPSMLQLVGALGLEYVAMHRHSLTESPRESIHACGSFPLRGPLPFSGANARSHRCSPAERLSDAHTDETGHGSEENAMGRLSPSELPRFALHPVSAKALSAAHTAAAGHGSEGDNRPMASAVGSLVEYFTEFSFRAAEAGIQRWIPDPGLGFGKTAEQCWEILSALEPLCAFGRPILIGAGDKRFTREIPQRVLDELGAVPGDGTSAAHALAARHCCVPLIFRIH